LIGDPGFFKSFIEDQVTCHPQKHTHCHPQLDWGSSVYFFSFNRSNKYFLDSRFRGNDKELTVIPINILTVIPNLIGDPGFFKSFIEDQVTCHPQKHTHCHPQLDWGSSVYFFSFNRSNKYFLDSRFRGNDKELTVIPINILTVIPINILTVIPNLIGDPVFISFLLTEVINTSWIPAFAGMTERLCGMTKS
jgi:hypothetical protein